MTQISRIRVDGHYCHICAIRVIRGQYRSVMCGVDTRPTSPVANSSEGEHQCESRYFRCEDHPRKHAQGSHPPTKNQDIPQRNHELDQSENYGNGPGRDRGKNKRSPNVNGHVRNPSSTNHGKTQHDKKVSVQPDEPKGMDFDRREYLAPRSRQPLLANISQRRCSGLRIFVKHFGRMAVSANSANGRDRQSWAKPTGKV